MPDYSSLKVSELKKILQERSLAVSGNKPDLIARLEENDHASAAAPTQVPSTAPAKVPAQTDDEIDWGDENSAEAARSTNAVVLEAGDGGQAPKPVAAPNRTVDADPPKTSDRSVKEPDNATTTEGTGNGQTKPAVNFTAGLEKTDLEKELERRRKRAKKFGLDLTETDEATAKALERAKKFGTEASSGNTLVKGLDQALPERGGRKRERGDEGSTEREGSKRGRVEGADRDKRVQKPQAGGKKSAPALKKVTDDPVEKAKAEARAKKFGTVK
ncbi:MAG: hypothetical protein M1824_006227 [Vezdaea acicularis]|nr:MAG: hypothetical protein M1824_006227 [Vezdaea acicularis]